MEQTKINFGLKECRWMRKVAAAGAAAMCMMLLPMCSGHNDAEKYESAAADEDKDLIHLSQEQVKTLGVQAIAVQPGEFSRVLKVSGEIAAQPGSEGIVSARQSGIVHFPHNIKEGMMVSAGQTVATVSADGMAGGNPNEAARVAYDAARRELERLKPLHDEGIVSTRDYNAALQRVEEAKVAMGRGPRANASATAPVAGVITSIQAVDGQYVDAGQAIATVGSNRSLSLRADVLATRSAELGEITGARFRPSYSDELVDLSAPIAASGAAVTAQAGYVPVYFSLPESVKGIAGTFCDVYLLGTPREGVISVPESAISEQQGRYFVYLLHSPGHFRKQAVELGATDGARREILSGIKNGDKVVTAGTTYVRLAESSGAVPEGHSHNH